eukprot:g8221.t1
MIIALLFVKVAQYQLLSRFKVQVVALGSAESQNRPFQPDKMDIRENREKQPLDHKLTLLTLTIHFYSQSLAVNNMGNLDIPKNLRPFLFPLNIHLFVSLFVLSPSSLSVMSSSSITLTSILLPS